MTILVDPPAWPAHGRRWSHLVSDESFAELHAFARRLGAPERGFEGDHYDIPEERYAAAVAAGAVPVSSRELLRRLQNSGLRRPKRRGERVLASILGPGPGERLDTVLSARAPIGVVRAVILIAQSGREVLALPDGDGLLLPRGPVAAPIDGAATGFDLRRAAAELAVAFLGQAWAMGEAAQVGYLRPVGASGRVGRATGGVQVVVRWTPPAGAPRESRVAEARWLDAVQVAGLLPPEIAPLVRARS